MQEFNRVKDPVIDQDNAKLLGALGGGYGAWKSHSKSIGNRKNILDRAMGRLASPATTPVRALVGAGLGALAAGTLARYVNKENKEDHQVDIANAYAQASQPGMQRYAAVSEDNKTDKVIGSGIRGGLLGTLAAAILGKNPLKGAGIGALANAGHTAYEQHKVQREANSQEDDIADYNNKYKETMGKEAGVRQTLKKLFPAVKKIAKKSTSSIKEATKNLKTNEAYLKRELAKGI